MIRKMILCALCLCLVFAAGCALSGENQPAIDASNLEGRRIGVGIAWSEDYVLSDTSDAELFRYQDLGTMLLALKSGHIDAIGLNDIAAKHVQATMPALQISEQPAGDDSLVAFFANGRETLVGDFNQFIQEFRETEEYKDILYRCNHLNNGVYESKEVLTDGDVGTISMVAEQVYPYIYWDFEKNKAAGSDVEFAQHFAKAAGYNLEIQILNYETAVLQIAYGQADMLMCALSNYFRSEVELNQLALVSEPYMDVPIMLVTVGKEPLGSVPDELS
ncbi:transporter substrate-binding domain-containing protein [Christensenellaceae bacterium OttesenSCG-928-K19]|nr:transporter substrate-binding domain-containing protein [Christensenellaceae bacterium OttesenSCG-928-K19]